MLAEKLLVVGFGKSGQSVAKRACEQGAEVWVYDEQSEIRNQKLEIRGLKEFKLTPGSGGLRTPDFDLVITSPGIPFDHAILRLAAKKKWPVASEIEFAYNLLNPNFVIGITGTNGKTTVVELLNHIFKLNGKLFTVAGNIGTPLSSLRNIEGPLILELSSFQLHFIDRFRANVAAVLNITEDHMDWHGCFGQYLRDKLRIFENQEESDVALLNDDDKALSGKWEVGSGKSKSFTKAKILRFGLDGSADYSLKGSYLTAFGQEILSVKDLKIKGKHNMSNTLAAIACAREAGLEWKTIIAGLKSFEGLKHRLQYIAEIDGVSYYNDSKSTNPDSTIKAIESFDQPIILIMGGRNKGNDFSSLKKYFGKQVKEIILFGEAANEIKEQITAGIVTKNVNDALEIARKKAIDCDIVLFSPGCSSFDLYKNYSERGDDFIRLVEALNG